MLPHCQTLARFGVNSGILSCRGSSFVLAPVKILFKRPDDGLCKSR